MKNFRIPVMGLATCALLFTSCAKTITKQEAIDFVKANYTSTEEKTPTRKVGEFSGRANTEESKALIVMFAKAFGFLKVTPDDLNEKIDTTEGLTPELVVNAKTIEQMPDDAEFKLKGKELIVTAKESKDGIDIKATRTFTSEGYPGSTSGEGSGKGEGVDFSFTFNITLTY